MLVSLVMLPVMDILTSFLPLVGESMGNSPVWVGVLLAVCSGTSIISRFMPPALGRCWLSRNGGEERLASCDEWNHEAFIKEGSAHGR